jgi:hypothetical protein
VGIGGRGKGGGARVIYYYHSEMMPNFLLGIFGKKMKVDLTSQERNDIRRVVPALV